jgi:hypothetical protein
MSRIMPEPRAMVNNGIGNENARINCLVPFNLDCSEQSRTKDHVIAVV